MPTVTDPEQTVRVDEIPDTLDDIDPARFVNKPIHDPNLKRNFSVIEPEFAFYQSHRLPFPREHFLTRLKKIARYSNTPIEMATQCHQCKKEITTYVNQTFTGRNVYCYPCYLEFLEQYR